MIWRLVVLFLGVTYLSGLFYFSFSQGSLFVTGTVVSVLVAIFVSVTTSGVVVSVPILKKVAIGACAIGIISQCGLIGINVVAARTIELDVVASHILFIIALIFIWHDIVNAPASKEARE